MCDPNTVIILEKIRSEQVALIVVVVWAAVLIVMFCGNKKKMKVR